MFGLTSNLDVHFNTLQALSMIFQYARIFTMMAFTLFYKNKNNIETITMSFFFLSHTFSSYSKLPFFFLFFSIQIGSPFRCTRSNSMVAFQIMFIPNSVFLLSQPTKWTRQSKFIGLGFPKFSRKSIDQQLLNST